MTEFDWNDISSIAPMSGHTLPAMLKELGVLWTSADLAKKIEAREVIPEGMYGVD